ncbi:Uncharacterized protein HZ326_22714 [Fusarium oxysporum f. sp. albedinis]|nr:Uncharacterized protein HZ326_22714 [Fusarium oxysporum f. sp. albedinis]
MPIARFTVYSGKCAVSRRVNDENLAGNASKMAVWGVTACADDVELYVRERRIWVSVVAPPVFLFSTLRGTFYSDRVVDVALVRC